MRGDELGLLEGVPLLLCTTLGSASAAKEGCALQSGFVPWPRKGEWSPALGTVNQSSLDDCLHCFCDMIHWEPQSVI